LDETTKEFHTTFEVQSLPTGMFRCLQLSHRKKLTVLGFFLILLGFGGILTGPISEVFGRNPVYIVSLTLFIVMDTTAAVATNLAPRIIFRGLVELFASGPLVCSAAALVDLWSLVERIYMFPYFIMTLELAATVVPVLGSNIVMATAVSWRFVDWTIIFKQRPCWSLSPSSFPRHTAQFSSNGRRSSFIV
jgi:MFS family permease